MTQPLISIIIPVKNSVQTIKACLESVFNQTFSSLEVLILDAVSTDGTLEEIKNFSKSEDRLRIYSEKDKGTYDAMNKGVQLAKGKWLFFLGSDDQLFDQLVLEKISKVMSHTKAKVVYGNVLIVGDTAWAKDGEIYAGKFTTSKLLNQNICHQAIFYQRDFLAKEIPPYNLDYFKSADWDLNLHCWSKGEFAYTDCIISRYATDGISANSHDHKLSVDFVSNVIKYFGFTLFDPLINHQDFVYYKDVLKLQKERNPFRYLTCRLKSVFLRIIHKFVPSAGR